MEMINEMTLEMTSELIPEIIPELTGDQVEIGDPDGCPLTIRAYSIISFIWCHVFDGPCRGAVLNVCSGPYTFPP